MATAEGLKAFLAKRGYRADVSEESPSTWLISLRSDTVEEVSKLLVNIGEPGRFIVSVKLADLVGVLSTELDLPTIIQAINGLKTTVGMLEKDMSKNTDSIRANGDELAKQATVTVAQQKDAIADINRQLDKLTAAMMTNFGELNEQVGSLATRVQQLESRPWYKRW